MSPGPSHTTTEGCIQGNCPPKGPFRNVSPCLSKILCTSLQTGRLCTRDRDKSDRESGEPTQRFSGKFNLPTVAYTLQFA